MSAAASSAEISAARVKGEYPAVFFPSILLRDRPVAQNETDGVAHHGPPAIKLSQSLRRFAAQKIDQQDGERGLVHLDAAPVRASVEPQILRPVAGGFLSSFEIAQHAHGVGDRPGGEQRARRFDQIARPDEVISAKIFVALVESPGNREAGDNAAEKIFGLVSSQDGGRRAIQIVLPQWFVELQQLGLPVAPLRDIVLGESRRNPRRDWSAPAVRPRSKSLRNRARERIRPLQAARSISPGERDVAVFSARIFPFHLRMLRKILPAVGGSDESDRHFFPWRRGCRTRG